MLWNSFWSLSLYPKAGPSETGDVDEKLPLSKALQGIAFHFCSPTTCSYLLFLYIGQTVLIIITLLLFRMEKEKKCIGLFFFNINELHKQNFSKPIFPFVNLVMNLEMGTWHTFLLKVKYAFYLYQHSQQSGCYCWVSHLSSTKAWWCLAWEGLQAITCKTLCF